MDADPHPDAQHHGAHTAHQAVAHTVDNHGAAHTAQPLDGSTTADASSKNEGSPLPPGSLNTGVFYLTKGNSYEAL